MIVLRRESGEELIFDAAPGQSWQIESLITDHPIESGSPVSDHTQRQPDKISIQVMVSETPMGQPGPTGAQRVREAKRFLEEALDGGELLELETRYGESGNWLLESFPFEVGRRLGVTFTLSLKKVRIAEVETVLLPRIEVASTTPAGVDVGEQPAEDIDGDSPEAERQLQSLGAMGFDKITSGFSNMASGLGF